MSSINVGSLRRLLDRGDFSVSEVSIPPAAAPLARHRHERAQLHLVLEGEYAEDARDGRHALGPGSILFRPAGELHANEFGDDAVHGVLIEFDGTPAGSGLPGLSAERPLYLSAPGSGALRFDFDREVGRKDAESETALTGLALCAVAEVSRLARGAAERRRPPAWVAKAVALVKRRSADDLRLARLAAAVGVSPVQLAAAFRRHLRCSVGEFLQGERLERARRLLVESDAAISEIALECGFCDQAHLTRVFRKRLGSTPAEFRRDRRP